MSIKSGPYGDPPRTARRDYFVVLLLLLWRMRYDLLLLAVIGALILSDTVPTNWQQSGSVVSIMGITVSSLLVFEIRRRLAAGGKLGNYGVPLLTTAAIGQTS